VGLIGCNTIEIYINTHVQDMVKYFKDYPCGESFEFELDEGLDEDHQIIGWARENGRAYDICVEYHKKLVVWFKLTLTFSGLQCKVTKWGSGFTREKESYSEQDRRNVVEIVQEYFLHP